MNQQIKQQWVEALRSGTYVQKVGQLKYADGFCVMGVLCDLHSRTTGIPWEERNFGTHISDRYMGSVSTPPAQVLAWAGLDGFWRRLEHLNDKEKLTFEALADYIERLY